MLESRSCSGSVRRKDLRVAQLATNQLAQIQRNSAQQTAIQVQLDRSESLASTEESGQSVATFPTATQVEPALPGEKFPETRTRVMTDSEVSEMSYAKIRYAINEMYARHGAEFASRPELRTQFQKFDWYRPQSGLSLDDIEAKFTDIERANRDLLAKYRDAKKP
jgi:hypothetical protein